MKADVDVIGWARPTRETVAVWAILVLAGAAAWMVTVAQARDMGPGPGTMGMAFPLFVGMWVAMMAAMMLPAIGPMAAGRGWAERRSTGGIVPRGLAFGAGFLMPWAAYGVVAFVVLSGAARLVDAAPEEARWLGVAILGITGLYQFTPWKLRALAHCRMAAHSEAVGSGGFRAGIRDGAICVGCCWALMSIFIALGVMNLAAMVGVAVAIFAEKILPRPRLVAGLVGLAFLVLAVVAAFTPSLVAGLQPEAMAHQPTMGGMEPTMGGMEGM